MSLAIDPADDPPFNPSLPISAPTNSLRSYIAIANGAWLFQEYAMFGEGAQVAADYGLARLWRQFRSCQRRHAAGRNALWRLVRLRYNQLLALQTAGFNNTNFSGPPKSNSSVRRCGTGFATRGWPRSCPCPMRSKTYLP